MGSVIDAIPSSVKDSVDLALMFKSIWTIWAAAAVNPVGAVLGMLGASAISAIAYWIYKNWVRAQNRKLAEIGAVVDRSGFIDREATKTEERNDKDNAGHDQLKDLP